MSSGGVGRVVTEETGKTNRRVPNVRDDESSVTVGEEMYPISSTKDDIFCWVKCD